MSAYLVFEPDGSGSIIRHLADEEALDTYLAECSRAAEDGVPDPAWLDGFPVSQYGSVNPGSWREGTALIVEVERVVVPRPVTQRWTV